MFSRPPVASAGETTFAAAQSWRRIDEVYPPAVRRPYAFRISPLVCPGLLAIADGLARAARRAERRKLCGAGSRADSRFVVRCRVHRQGLVLATTASP